MTKQLLFFLLLFFGTGIIYSQQIDYRKKTKGFLLGTMIGDAAGGPYEFAWPPKRKVWSKNSQVLTPELIETIAGEFALIPYQREAEPFGQWIKDAPAGSITDDTRLKLIFINSLGGNQKITVKRFARTLIKYPDTVEPEFHELADKWLEQFMPSALYVSGQRKNPKAKPPQTIWAGVPSNLGQMTFTPLAAIYPNQPELCYQKTWEVDYFDFGFSKDMHASINAGLSHAYNDTATWKGIKQVMIATDPYKMNDIPWAKRRTAFWIKFAEKAAERSQGKIDKLFHILETEMQAIQWWDTWVPLVVMISIGEITGYDPLATMQLSIEFGHDTDSYAQLIGAFMGVLHGPDIFSKEMQRQVTEQLNQQYGVKLEDLVNKLL